jgi:hypothetical protein
MRGKNFLQFVQNGVFKRIAKDLLSFFPSRDENFPPEFCSENDASHVKATRLEKRLEASFRRQTFGRTFYLARWATGAVVVVSLN